MCSALFAANTSITLEVTPEAGSTFTGWTGPADCSDSNVTLTADITCTATFTPTYTIGGSVAGLGSGKSVTLLNNGGDSQPISANGAFTFTTPVASGGGYAVTVGIQPIGQTCTVSNGSGIATANVTTVAVNCATTYTITYNGNGNTGGNTPTEASSPYASGSTVTVLGNTGNLVKTGYTFSGWNTADNGSGSSYAPGATFTISDNITLYAQWTAVPALSPATQTVSGSVGSPITATTVYTATGFTGSVSYAISPALPAGLSLNASTGVISGTPTAIQATTSHTVTGTGATSGTATATVNLTISSAADLPTVTTPALPNGVVDIPYAVTLGASGGEPPYTYAGLGQPAGLALSPEGVLSGIPTTPGPASVAITVTDRQGQTGQRIYPLTVATTLTITTPSLIAGVKDRLYAQTLTAVGGILPYAWSLSAGELPRGLTLDPATGQISGAPQIPETQTFTVQITDRAGQTAAQSLTLTILNPSFDRPDPVDVTKPPVTAALTVNPAAGSTCAVNDAQSLTLNLGEQNTPVTGPVGFRFPHGLLQIMVVGCTAGETTLTLTLVYPGQIPPGAKFWKYGQTITNPTAHWYVMDGAVIAGNTVTYTVRDGGFGDDDLTANGEITDPGGPAVAALALAGTLPATGQTGIVYSGTLTAQDGIGPYGWSVAGGTLPPGMTLNTTDQATTTLSGTPTQAGTYPFTLQVVDQGQGNTFAQQAFTVQVAASPQTYTVTPTAGVGGRMDPALPQTVGDRTTATFTVTPDAGYTLAGITGCDGVLIGNHYTTAAITADCTVSATFNAVGKQNQTITFAALADQVWGTPPFPINAAASSGLPVSFTASGPCTMASATVTLTGVGTCTITAQQLGDASYNPAPEVSQRFAITAGTPIPTTTTLTSAPNPSTAGRPITLTATVSSASGSPSGTVAFQEGNMVLCTVALAQGSASLTVSTLTAGPHALTAAYSGDTTFAASQGATTQTVTADIPTLSEWAMLLLTLLLSGLAWNERRRFG